MHNLLIPAIVAITLALVFYSTGVWAEHKGKELKQWHVNLFWIGLAFDTIGTTLMSIMARGDAESTNQMITLVHGTSGAIAILLMAIHAVWATSVIRGKNQKKKLAFHKFSVVVWAIWLIPYIAGMVMGMI
jgi:uncharacterized repeat protein (TIGR03987 family)